VQGIANARRSPDIVVHCLQDLHGGLAGSLAESRTRTEGVS